MHQRDHHRRAPGRARGHVDPAVDGGAHGHLRPRHPQAHGRLPDRAQQPERVLRSARRPFPLARRGDAVADRDPGAAGPADHQQRHVHRNRQRGRSAHAGERIGHSHGRRTCRGSSCRDEGVGAGRCHRPERRRERDLPRCPQCLVDLGRRTPTDRVRRQRERIVTRHVRALRRDLSRADRELSAGRGSGRDRRLHPHGSQRVHRRSSRHDVHG